VHADMHIRAKLR